MNPSVKWRHIFGLFPCDNGWASRSAGRRSQQRGAIGAYPPPLPGTLSSHLFSETCDEGPARYVSAYRRLVGPIEEQSA